MHIKILIILPPPPPQQKNTQPTTTNEQQKTTKTAMAKKYFNQQTKNVQPLFGITDLKNNNINIYYYCLCLMLKGGGGGGGEHYIPCAPSTSTYQIQQAQEILPENKSSQQACILFPKISRSAPHTRYLF